MTARRYFDFGRATIQLVKARERSGHAEGCKESLDKRAAMNILLRMAISTDTAYTEETAEVRRRILLAESDLLLEDVETLRLRDEVDAPTRLRDAIRALQIRLGRRHPQVAPATLEAELIKMRLRGRRAAGTFSARRP